MTPEPGNPLLDAIDHLAVTRHLQFCAGAAAETLCGQDEAQAMTVLLDVILDEMDGLATCLEFDKGGAEQAGGVVRLRRHGEVQDEPDHWPPARQAVRIAHLVESAVMAALAIESQYERDALRALLQVIAEPCGTLVGKLSALAVAEAWPDRGDEVREEEP